MSPPEKVNARLDESRIRAGQENIGLLRKIALELLSNASVKRG